MKRSIRILIMFLVAVGALHLHLAEKLASVEEPVRNFSRLSTREMATTMKIAANTEAAFDYQEALSQMPSLEAQAAPPFAELRAEDLMRLTDSDEGGITEPADGGNIASEDSALEASEAAGTEVPPEAPETVATDTASEISGEIELDVIKPGLVSQPISEAVVTMSPLDGKYPMIVPAALLEETTTSKPTTDTSPKHQTAPTVEPPSETQNEPTPENIPPEPEILVAENTGEVWQQTSVSSIRDSLYNWYSDRTVWGLANIVSREDMIAYSETIWAAHVWVILNRLDSSKFPNDFDAILSAPNQFDTYSSSIYTSVPDAKVEWVTRDVLARYIFEQMGAPPEQVGRVLPRSHCFFKKGSATLNYFYSYCWGDRYNPFNAPYNPYAS